MVSSKGRSWSCLLYPLVSEGETHATLCRARFLHAQKEVVRHAEDGSRVTSSGSITIIGRNDGEASGGREKRGNQRHESRDAVPVGIN